MNQQQNHTPSPSPSTVDAFGGLFIRAVRAATTTEPATLDATAARLGVPIAAASEIAERLAMRGLVRVWRHVGADGRQGALHVAPVGEA